MSQGHITQSARNCNGNQNVFQELHHFWLEGDVVAFVELLKELNKTTTRKHQRHLLLRAVRQITGEPIHDFLELRAEYIPTPEEIRAECESIQLAWTRKERRRRELKAFGQPVFYTIPQAKRHRQSKGRARR